jgi:hypothetical protein
LIASRLTTIHRERGLNPNPIKQDQIKFQSTRAHDTGADQNDVGQSELLMARTAPARSCRRGRFQHCSSHKNSRARSREAFRTRRQIRSTSNAVAVNSARQYG